MTFFGPDLRNGLPIGLGSVAGFGIAPRFSPASLFAGGINGAWYDPSDPTTLFSDRAGTTPCGTPGQGSVVPVGAMLDERAVGYSVYFDGTGDYLEAPDNAAFAFGSGNFTIEGWIYLTAYAAVDADGLYNAAIYTQQQSFPTNSKSVLFYLQGTASSYTSIIFTGSSDNVTSTTITGSFTFALNTWYHVACVRNGNNVYLYVNGTQVNSTTAFSLTLQDSTVTPKIGAALLYSGFNYFWYLPGHISNLRIVKGTAVYTGNFTPPTAPLSPISGTSLLTCGTSWTGNPAITKNGDARVDGLNPFTASPVGNHAIAANDTTARPELSARVNLLTYSEQFDNAAWVKSNVTVTPNTTTAPDGTTTADTCAGAAGSAAYFNQSVNVVANVGYAFVIYAKTNTTSILQIAGGSTGFASSYANFDLSDGSLGTVSGSVAAITSVGNGWWRCQVTQTASNSDINNFFIALVPSKTSARVANLTANASVFIWGADLRPTNIGTTIPAYQRVADQYTYDAVGFPRYLAANGTSSAMSTPGNVNLSGTDKVTVFAGVRRLGNTSSAGIIQELSSDGDSNNGCVLIYAEPTTKYGVNSRGTARALAQTLNAYSPPITNILTGVGEISTDTCILRVNGAQVATSATDQGTGNYGSYPLFIGARNNASLFLNGNIYSLIVVGSAVSAGNITATESWVNNKVGGAY